MALPLLASVTLSNTTLPPWLPPAGTQLQLQPCVSSVYRSWSLPSAPAPGPVVHTYTGMCVSYAPATTNIELQPCVPGAASQTFSWDAASGIVTQTSTPSLCWDVQYYGNSSGATLGLYGECSPPMSWNVFSFQASSGFITQNSSSNGTGLCVDAGTASPPPIPTPQQLRWMRGEVGVMISYDLVTQLPNVSNPQHFCIGAGGDKGFPVPPASDFNPSALSTDSWIQAAVAMGASYTLLVASHCSGFLLWPSKVYNYTVAASPWRNGGGDVVADYVASSAKYDMPFGFYLTWNYNYLYNAGFCGGADGGPCNDTNGWPYVPGQVQVTQDEYNAIMLATIEEVWSRYPGQIYEVWFDGSEHSAALNTLFMQLQPQAIAVTGTVPNGNNANLDGKESGYLGYPVWDSDTGNPMTATAFLPSEGVTPILLQDAWFWKPQIGLRSLGELQGAYVNTVGVGAVMELGIIPDDTGVIAADQMALLTAFGEWRTRCYSAAAAVMQVTNVTATTVTLTFPANTFPVIDKVVLSEDLTQGQQVLAYDIIVQPQGGYAPPIIPAGSGTAVGNKRIHFLTTGPVPLMFVTVNVTSLRPPFTSVNWASVGAYGPCS